ncbi:hypothetical protein BGLA2_170013 [Burkholderia gladioli]|nr:hypothetical protein BGLA2_170013 [Burkholderia gladioli]
MNGFGGELVFKIQYINSLAKQSVMNEDKNSNANIE